MSRIIHRLNALLSAVLLDAAAVAPGGGGGPSAGDGLLLERDTDGTEFLLLETGDFLLLEG